MSTEPNAAGPLVTFDSPAMVQDEKAQSKKKKNLSSPNLSKKKGSKKITTVEEEEEEDSVKADGGAPVHSLDAKPETIEEELKDIQEEPDDESENESEEEPEKSPARNKARMMKQNQPAKLSTCEPVSEPENAAGESSTSPVLGQQDEKQSTAMQIEQVAGVEEQDKEQHEEQEDAANRPALPTSLLGMIEARRIATPLRDCAVKGAAIACSTPVNWTPVKQEPDAFDAITFKVTKFDPASATTDQNKISSEAADTTTEQEEVEEVEESAPALPTSLLGMINARRIATPVKVAAPDITKKSPRSSGRKRKKASTPAKSPAPAAVEQEEGLSEVMAESSTKEDLVTETTDMSTTVEEEDAVPTRTKDELRELRVVDLKVELKELGASTDGRKFELVDRLWEFLTTEADESEEEAESSEEEVVEEEEEEEEPARTKKDLQSMKVGELRDELAALDMATDGVKFKLVDRLWKAVREMQAEPSSKKSRQN